VETAWGWGAARRGSLRCLSAESTGAAPGFFSVGSVALARADSELIVAVKGEPEATPLDAVAGAGGAATGTGMVITGVAPATGADGVATGAGGRGGAA
jgi:hypothetical protein